MKHLRLFSFFLIVVFVCLFVSSYTRSTTNYGLFTSGISTSSSSYSDVCAAGQDFLVQVAPLGCVPTVVTSDLLEDQNVPVFCQLAATQINPLVDVKAIESISFSGDYPEIVSGLGFHPAQSALGTSGNINNAILENIGYVVVILKKTPAERDMPDFVEGNLTAKIKYDLEDAFGIGKTSFYLPELTDSEWSSEKSKFSFWNGKGLVRAVNIDEDSATILLYDENGQRVSSPTLKVGESVSDIYFTGFDCLTSLSVKLVSLVNPGTKARLNIDGKIVEVGEGEKFLDNACTLRSIKNNGLFQKVKIYCNQDSDVESKLANSFELTYSPQIQLNIGGETKTAVVGDKLFEKIDGSTKKYFYLGYVGSKKNSFDAADLHVVLFESSVSRDKLSETYLNSISDFIEGKVKSSLENSYTLKINSETTTLHYLPYTTTGGISGKRTIGEREISIVGFGNVQNLGSSQTIKTVFNLQGYYKISDDIFSATIAEPSFSIKIFTNSEINFFDLIETSFDFTQEDDGYFYPDNDNDYGDYSSTFNNVKYISFDSGAESLTLYKSVDVSGGDAGTDFYNYYSSALNDYNSVLTQFSGESAGSLTFGEEALIEKIKLASQTNRVSDLVDFCSDFEVRYKDSSSYSAVANQYCAKEAFLNQEISSRMVYVNGESNLISFQKAYAPEVTDYGAQIRVKVSDNDQRIVTLGKDEKYYIDGSTNEFIQLTSVSKTTNSAKGSVKLSVNLKKSNSDNSYVSGTKTLSSGGEVVTLGSKYIFELEEIYLKKEAKVLIEPSIKDTGTSANFSFKIGIEKRAIQLTPAETEEKIKNLNESIEKWSEIQEKIGDFVQVMKGTCLAVEAVLTIKNFLGNVDGSAIARKQVMRGVDGSGGWYDLCNEKVKKGEFSTVNECLLENNDEIESSVNKLTGILQNKNSEFKILQEGCTKSNTFSSSIDEDCLKRKYLTEDRINGLIENLNSKGITEVSVGGNKVDVNSDNFKDILSSEVSVTEFRDMEVYLDAIDNDILSDTYKKELAKDLGVYYSNRKESAERASVESDLKSAGYEGEILSYDNKKTITAYYYGATIEGSKIIFGDLDKLDSFDLKKKYPFQVFSYKNANYVAFLKASGSNSYNILEVYGYSSIGTDGKLNLLQGTANVIKEIESNFKFTLADETSYKNAYKNPKVRYYTSEPNVGVPAIVPFDKKNGWYAAVALSTDSAVEASGAVKTFWLCNVGLNGEEEDKGGDDMCQRINVYQEATYTSFAGLSSSNTQTLVKKAISAIETAQKAYKDGLKYVTINGERYDVGEDYADVPSVECQDFMSPQDCNLLFNVCDPVMCPSSRCDFGGSYKVKDVIQSGIVGSILLCLPNFREGIYIPICISGIHAGLQGYVSILENHRDCLQESLDSGEMVGVCDEIYSIYLCEFFWEQALPLTKIALPKFFEWIYGQNVRGGGEYLGVQTAWESASASIDYFTDYYAVNSFEAFKARSTEEVGTDICQAYVSGVYPTENILGALTQPDSPPQFHGTLDSEIFNDAVFPSVSQYKVFYHIYAGEDSRAAYKVYMKAEGGASIYEDSSIRVVATGYVSKGEYESETLDFTAPTGFTKLCIRVNQYEDCGFGASSTSFAATYVGDLYAQEQATETDITTEDECVSGSSSAYSLLNLNLQSGIEDLLDSDLASLGINRVCATKNPGSGTDEDRWVDVGYCDDKNIRCWIDKDSVEDVIDVGTIENETLKTLSERALEALMSKNDYIENDDEFSSVVSEIEALSTSGEKISKITEVLKRAFYNHHKARLYLMRGAEYGKLAFTAYEKYVSSIESTKTEEVEGETEGGEGETPVPVDSSEGYDLTQLDERIRFSVCFYLGEGASKEFAAYMTGNLQQESSLNPTAVEKEGTQNGRGIVQWDVRDRWKNLQTWASEEGDCNYETLLCQLKYTLNEDGESSRLKNVKTSSDKDAIKSAISKYERWHDYDKTNWGSGLGNRWEYAEYILSKLNSGGYSCEVSSSTDRALSSSYDVSGYDVVLIGDSITVGYSNYLSGLKTGLDTYIGGKGTDWMVTTALPNAIKMGPKIVVVLGGTNDGLSSQYATTLTRLTQIKTNLVAKGIKVIFLTLPPWGDDYTGASKANENIDKLNDEIEKFADISKGVYVVDIHDKSLGISDNEVHPNSAGYQLIAKLVYEKIVEISGGEESLQNTDIVENRCEECGEGWFITCKEDACSELGDDCYFNKLTFGGVCAQVTSCEDCSKFSNCDLGVCGKINTFLYGANGDYICSFESGECNRKENNLK